MGSGIRQNFFIAPAFRCSCTQAAIRNAQFSAPLGYCHTLAIKFQKMIGAGIIGLDKRKRPDAIFRRIPQVIIKTLNAVPRSGRFTHISDKIVKRRQPAVANGNASCAIRGIFMIAGIMATVLNGIPRSFQFGRKWLSGKSSGDFSAFTDLVSQASARTVFSTLDLSTQSQYDIAANTLTPPLMQAGGLLSLSCISQYGQAVKSQASQILKSTFNRMVKKFNVIFSVCHLIKTYPFNYLARLGEVLIAPLRAVFIISHQKEVSHCH